jgi:hypothetical protein
VMNRYATTARDYFRDHLPDLLRGARIGIT